MQAPVVNSIAVCAGNINLSKLNTFRMEIKNFGAYQLYVMPENSKERFTVTAVARGIVLEPTTEKTNGKSSSELNGLFKQDVSS